MNLFSISLVRKTIKNDIKIIKELIDKKMVDLNALKTQLNNEKKAFDKMLSDTDIARLQNEEKIHETKNELERLNSLDVSVAEEPKEVCVDPLNGLTVCSHEELNNWLNKIPRDPINKHCMRTILENKFRGKVTEYINKKQVYDNAKTNHKNHLESIDKATKELLAMQDVEKCNLRNTQSISKSFNKNINNSNAEIKKLAGVIKTLMDAELMLRKKLIDTEPVLTTDIHEQVMQTLQKRDIQLLHPDLFVQLKKSKDILKQEQKALNIRHQQYCKGIAILIMMGMAAGYYKKEDINFGEILSILTLLMVGAALYRFTGSVDKIANHVGTGVKAVEKLCSRIDDFLTNLEDTLDQTSSAAIQFMTDMRNQTEKGIQLADHGMTNAVIWANLFKGDMAIASKEIGKSIEYAGEAVGNGAEMAGKHIANNMRCTIF